MTLLGIKFQWYWKTWSNPVAVTFGGQGINVKESTHFWKGIYGFSINDWFFGVNRGFSQNDLAKWIKDNGNKY